MAKTLLQITVFWSFFLWLVPTVIVWIEGVVGTPRFVPQPMAGWLLFLVMGSIGFYCGMTFAIRGGGTPLPLDTTTRFVVMGPYRIVRNPMAMTGTMQGVAVGLMLGSPVTIVYSVAGMVLWHVIARPWEEDDLERRFGDAYRQYRREVRCWIPRLRPYEQICALPDDAS